MEYEKLRSLIEEVLDREDINDDYTDNEELSEILAKGIIQADSDGKLTNFDEKKLIVENNKQRKRLIRPN